MSKLKELYDSLATVIVRYHDGQSSVTKLIAETEPAVLRKKSREHAIAILQNQALKFDQQLKSIIDACTNGYPDRKHFLHFMLHEITFLKAQQDRKTSYQPLELLGYQKQITQLLIDLRELLKTVKGTMYKVKYSKLNGDSETPIDLSGLINNGYMGGRFCYSGLLLMEEVLGRFHMTESSSDEEIKEIASDLCMEHQNALLVAELKTQKLELEVQNKTHQTTSAELRVALNKTQEEVIQTKSEQEKTHAELLQAKSDLQKTQSELQELKALNKREEPQKTSTETVSNPLTTKPQYIPPLLAMAAYSAYNTRLLQRGALQNPTPRFFPMSQQTTPTPPRQINSPNGIGLSSILVPSPMLPDSNDLDDSSLSFS